MVRRDALASQLRAPSIQSLGGLCRRTRQANIVGVTSRCDAISPPWLLHLAMTSWTSSLFADTRYIVRHRGFEAH
jgi:hypothetical protein